MNNIITINPDSYYILPFDLGVGLENFLQSAKYSVDILTENINSLDIIEQIKNLLQKKIKIRILVDASILHDEIKRSNIKRTMMEINQFIEKNELEKENLEINWSSDYISKIKGTYIILDGHTRNSQILISTHSLHIKPYTLNDIPQHFWGDKAPHLFGGLISFGVILKYENNSEIIEQMINVFNFDWNNREIQNLTSPSLSWSNGLSLKNLFCLPFKFLSLQTNDELKIHPKGNACENIQDFLSSAEKEILISARYLTSLKIVDLIIEMLNKGINIQIILQSNKENLPVKIHLLYNCLQSERFRLFLNHSHELIEDQELFIIDHSMIIIDQKKAWISAQGLDLMELTNHRSTGVFIAGKIIDELLNIFDLEIKNKYVKSLNNYHFEKTRFPSGKIIFEEL